MQMIFFELKIFLDLIKVPCILLPSGFVHQGLYAEAIVGKLIWQTDSKLLENIMFSQEWSLNPKIWL